MASPKIRDISYHMVNIIWLPETVCFQTNQAEDENFRSNDTGTFGTSTYCLSKASCHENSSAWESFCKGCRFGIKENVPPLYTAFRW